MIGFEGHFHEDKLDVISSTSPVKKKHDHSNKCINGDVSAIARGKIPISLEMGKPEKIQIKEKNRNNIGNNLGLEKVNKIANKTFSHLIIKNKEQEALEAKLLLMQKLLDLQNNPENAPPNLPIDGREGRQGLEESHLQWELLAEKQNFMVKCCDASQASRIHSQAREFPIMHAAIKELAKSYDEWTLNLTAHEESCLRDKIKNQHKALEMLSSHIIGLAGHAENKQAFRLMGSSENTVIHTVRSIMSGEPISEGFLFSELRAFLMEALIRSKEDGAAPLKPTISSKAIAKQASLFKAQREGRRWAETQPDLPSLGTSINQVSVLPGNESAAVFKQGHGNEGAAGYMEHLVWDIAVIMGLEGCFTATKQTTINTMGNQTGISGGIQEFQECALLKKIPPGSELFNKITVEKLLSPMVASLAFGMYDAHSNNIMVDGDGNILFFDNTRSLPNSNDFINRGEGKIVPTYRCGLLGLPASYARLTIRQRRALIGEIENLKNRFEDVSKYVKTKQVQKRIAKLPPGWFDTDKTLKAMHERICRMEEAVRNPQNKSLFDLALAVNPEMKFLAGLHIITEQKLKLLNIPKDVTPGQIQEIQRKIYSHVGYFSINQLLHDCITKGLDPHMVKEICLRNISHEDSLREVIKYVESHSKTTIEKQERAKYKENEKSILKEIESFVEIDLKDWNRSLSSELFFRDQAAKSGIELHANLSYAQRCNLLLNEPPPNGFLINQVPSPIKDKPDDFLLAYIGKDDQIHEILLDIYTIPGKIIIKDEKPMNMSELKDWIKSNII